MSLPRYPEYKDSGVNWLGEIPVHWHVVQSRRYFSQRKDKALDGDRQLTASQKYGVLYQDTFTEIEGQKVVQVILGADILKHVEPNDFVISMRSFQGGIEWCAFRGSISSAYVMLIPSSQIDVGFFRYLFKSAPYIQALQSTSNLVRDGQALRFSNFAQVDLPLMPLAEQHAIATFLDRETAKIDALIAEQEKLLALLAEKRQATISHAVTRGLNPNASMRDSGIPWLGEVPAHWLIGGLTKFIGPVVDYRGRTPAKGDAGTFLVTAKNVRNGAIDYAASEEYVDPVEANALLSRGRPEVGDVLFTTEAPLGQVAQIDRTDIALAQRIVKFRGLEGVLINRFLMYWLMGSACQSRLETLATGSTALGIKASKLGMIECLVPPIPEQQKIVGHIDRQLSKFTDLEVEAVRGIDLLRERRSALISAAVTGKIDVRGAV